MASKSQQRSRLKRVREYNDAHRGKGGESGYKGGAKTRVRRPAEFSPMHGAEVDQITAALAKSDKYKGVQIGTVISAEGSEVGGHLVFGVRKHANKKAHAVVDGGTKAVCGKDVGEWQPDGDLVLPWFEYTDEQRCKHCVNLLAA